MPARPSVFMSYRRDPSADLARYIYERLDAMGADVFFDVEDINGGHFDATIEREIIARQHLLVILAPRTLESEWVRRELETAFKHGKNIIPVETGGFSFEQHVPPELAELKRYGGIPYDFKSPETTFKRLAKALQLAVPSSQPVMPTQPEGHLAALQNWDNRPSPSSPPAASQPSLIRRLRLNEPWAIILAALITVGFPFLVSQVNNQQNTGAATPTIPVTSIAAVSSTDTPLPPTSTDTAVPPTSTDTPLPPTMTNTPQLQPSSTVTINYQLDETATQIMLQRTAAAKSATNEALFAESTDIAETANAPTSAPTATTVPSSPTPILATATIAVDANPCDAVVFSSSGVTQVNIYTNHFVTAPKTFIPVGTQLLAVEKLPPDSSRVIWVKVEKSPEIGYIWLKYDNLLFSNELACSLNR